LMCASPQQELKNAAPPLKIFGVAFRFVKYRPLNPLPRRNPVAGMSHPFHLVQATLPHPPATQILAVFGEGIFRVGFGVVTQDESQLIFMIPPADLNFAGGVF